MDWDEQFKSMRWFIAICGLILLVLMFEDHIPKSWVEEPQPDPMVWENVMDLHYDDVDTVANFSIKTGMKLRAEWAASDKEGIAIFGDKAIPLTELTEEGLKVQEEKGCLGCH